MIFEIRLRRSRCEHHEVRSCDRPLFEWFEKNQMDRSPPIHAADLSTVSEWPLDMSTMHNYEDWRTLATGELAEERTEATLADAAGVLGEAALFPINNQQ